MSWIGHILKGEPASMPLNFPSEHVSIHNILLCAVSEFSSSVTTFPLISEESVTIATFQRFDIHDITIVEDLEGISCCCLNSESCGKAYAQN